MSTVHLDLKSIADDSEGERLHLQPIDLATLYIECGYYSRDLMPHQPTLVWCFFSLQWRPKRGWFLLICYNMERPIADMKRRTKRVEIKRKRSGEWAGWYTAVHFNLEMFQFLYNHVIEWYSPYLVSRMGGQTSPTWLFIESWVKVWKRMYRIYIRSLPSCHVREGQSLFIWWAQS